MTASRRLVGGIFIVSIIAAMGVARVLASGQRVGATDEKRAAAAPTGSTATGSAPSVPTPTGATPTVPTLTGPTLTGPTPTGRTPTGATRAPVLVELFTSEGCSSCPPADDMLAWLVAEQPVPGVEVIALGFHVDYWDRLGWRDRFASPTYTARQDTYSRTMRSDKIYTPQMVVDGTHEFIGNDPNLARRFIGEAGGAPKLPITAEAQPDPADAGRVALKIEVRPSAEATLKGDVLVVVTEDGLVSDVQRGENAKKRLSHVAVVRSIDRVGQIKPGEIFATTRAVSVDKKWRREGVKLVVLVQQAKTGRVIGVTTARL